MQYSKQPWIYSQSFDGIFILAPAFFVSSIVLLFPSVTASMKSVPLWAWGILVMGIDVSHVYSTLFRTYFDPEELEERRALYLAVPVLCWFLGVILYSVGPLIFWRVLAYAAVYHFIRQQYGFMMIYRRREGAGGNYNRRIDQLAIYLATIYPIVYWHTHIPRQFSWFIDGDFVSIHLPFLESLVWSVYVAVLAAYLLKESYQFRLNRTVNVPKNLLLVGTVLSWYIGIVAYNGDMAFTLTNVVTHGIPYMALVWAYGRKKWSVGQFAVTREAPNQPLVSRVFSIKALPIFCGVLLLLAYLEEAIWDGLVWREHASLFRGWHALPDLSGSSILVWLVPLLVVPQVTHYVLDGFIWKLKRPDPNFTRLLKSDAGEGNSF